MAALTRRNFIVLTAAAVAAPAILRLGLDRAASQTAGLVGDGKVNDLPALRRMLSEVERRGKGTVRLPAGRFLLMSERRESAITLPANARLEGAGRDSTVLVMADGAFGHVINAPFGWVQIADLTVDGNEKNRPGTVGHNLRLTGDNIVVERTRVLNSVSYGIGIGQRRFARNIVIRDVEILDAGADGIDVKNDFDRTENVLIENVTVKGFGRPDLSLPAKLVGSQRDKRRDKAGIDLRGKCEVRGLVVEGVLPGRNGLRFRHGEKGISHGAGAHGSKASNVQVRHAAGERSGTAIMVVARDVEINNAQINGTHIGIFEGAANLSVTKGNIENCAYALYIAKTHVGTPDQVRLADVQFGRASRFELKDFHSITFERCVFDDCTQEIEKSLKDRPGISLVDSRFSTDC